MMMIRIGEKRDLEEIVAIYNDAIFAGFQTADTEKVTAESRAEWFNGHCNSEHPLFVAIVDDSVVGYLTLSPYRPGRSALKNTVEVSFYLKRNYQGKGIGNSLLNYAISFCKQNNYKSIFAIVIDLNTVSINFFKKHGFEEWGKLPQIGEFRGIEFGHLYFGKKLR